MFTGLVQGTATVIFLDKSQSHFLSLALKLPERLTHDLDLGASIAVDGVCLTVTQIKKDIISFEVIKETLEKTNLKKLELGRLCNVERSVKLGQELGGHVVSGHVIGEGTIIGVSRNDYQTTFEIQCAPSIAKYIFHKGFIALDGISLTLDYESNNGIFKVHLIPETLKRTTFIEKDIGDTVNIEIESQILAVVESVERVLKQLKSKDFDARD